MKIVFGYFFIALSVLILLALISFTPYDSLLFISKVNIPPQNIAGHLGSFISSYIVLLYGRWAGYLLGFAVFVMGVNILTERKIGTILIKFSLFVIAVISLSVILALSLSVADFIECGMVGILVANGLTELIHPTVVIIIFSLILLMALSGAIKLFRSFAGFIGKGIGTVVLLPFKAFGLIINRDEAEQKSNAVDTEHIFEQNIMTDANNNLSDHPDIYHTYAVESNYDEMIPTGTASKNESKTTSPFKTNHNEPSFLRSDVVFDEPSKNETDDENNKSETNPIKIVKTVPSWLDDGGENSLMSDIDNAFEDVISEKNEVSFDINEQDTSIEANDKTVQEATELKEESDDKTNSLFPSIEESLTKDETIDLTSEGIELGKKPKETEKPKSKTKKKRSYFFPEINNLDRNLQTFSYQEEEREIKQTGAKIEATFESFKINIKVSGYSRGPAITRYEIIPPEGLKLKTITNLEDDLALKLGTKNIRIVAPIGGRSIIGVEVPNRHRKTIVIRDIIESTDFKKADVELPLILGEDITGNIIIEDLAKMPHLLIGGTTGSGKSIYVNSLISGLLFKLKQNKLKFIMIDPKMVELELYNGIPHLLAPIITQPEEALAALEWAVQEMDKRYTMLAEFSVRNLKDYNTQAKSINKTRQSNDEPKIEELPYIVIIIDEFANLMLRSPKETEKAISRIAAMARAVGIHLIIATQRPSVDVVTGIIKANFPSRIAFRVNSKTDSRTILDENGAQSLLNKGDMLFRTPAFPDMFRIQAPFVSNSDVENIVSELKKNGAPDYSIDFDELTNASSGGSEGHVDSTNDPLWEEALRIAVDEGTVSASFLQRKLRIGYNRASRIMDAMVSSKILGPSRGSSKPREVIISQADLVNYL